MQPKPRYSSLSGFISLIKNRKRNDMNNQQEILKELRKFCYSSMNKLLWIPIGIFVMMPSIYDLFFGTKNGYLLTVIVAIVIFVFLKIRNSFAADEFNKLLGVVKEDGLYEVLLQDFAKNKNNLFHNLMLGNFFIIERNGGSMLILLPYKAINSLQLFIPIRNSDGENNAQIRIASNDKRYQRLGEQTIFINPKNAKADYEMFCRHVLERNPNVFYK